MTKSGRNFGYALSDNDHELKTKPGDAGFFCSKSS
jgi:hypothetical protein